MSRLDLVDGRELVGRLDVGEGVLQLALPGRVRPERVAGRGHPGLVEPDQPGRDVADRLARPALGLGPVGAAEPVQRRRLAAGVPGHLVELVGGQVQPVRRLAALARRVLDHQVVAGRALDGAAGHLHVPADAVLLVHDVVARRELQRVDAAAAAARHPPGLPRARPRARPGRPRPARPAAPTARRTRPPAARWPRAPRPARARAARSPVARPRRAPSARSSSASRCAGPWPSVISTTRHWSGQPLPHVRDRARGIAAVPGAGSALIANKGRSAGVALVGGRGLRRVGRVSCYGCL